MTIQEFLAQPIDIVQYPHEALRTKCERVTHIDDDLIKFGKAMLDIVEQKNAQGLAANQLGVPLAIIVVRNKIYLNPHILVTYEKFGVDSEGCLSINYGRTFFKVRRSLHIWVDAMNLKGDDRIYDLYGNSARVFQHEVDHLNGVTLYDK